MIKRLKYITFLCITLGVLCLLGCEAHEGSAKLTKHDPAPGDAIMVN